VYVAWVGTDANGEYFTSGNSRFSRFRQYSIGSLFDAAQKEVSSVCVALYFPTAFADFKGIFVAGS
jgi:hypothetical protein